MHLITNPFVLIKFHNTSGYGTRIWVDNINVDGTQGITEATIGQIKVYPNPNNGTFTIETPNRFQNGIYQLFSMDGRQVYSGAINGNKQLLNFDDLSSGAYLFQFIFRF